MKFIPAALLIGLLCIAFSLMSCGGNSATIPINKTVPKQTATLNVYQENASWSTIQVSWKGQTEATDLAYQQDTGPLMVQAGAGTLDVTGPALPLHTPFPASLSLTPSTTNTYLIWGWGELWGLTLLTADETSPQSSAAKLRVESCQTETPTDLFVMASGSSPTGTPNYKQLLCNFPKYQGEPAATYQTLPPGAYDIFFTWPSTTQVLYRASIILAANQNRTLILLNNCASA